MFLARVPPDPTAIPIIPSFHRPKLIETASNYPMWNDANYHSFRRRFIFRPMPWDHPDFTGSNSNLAPQTLNGYVLWTGGVDAQPGFLGVDDDGDYRTDYAALSTAPDDPGCAGPNSMREDPQCSNGIDDDGDGKADFDGAGLGAKDPQCAGPAGGKEKPDCGLGAELALLVPILAALRGRRGRTVRRARHRG